MAKLYRWMLDEQLPGNRDRLKVENIKGSTRAFFCGDGQTVP